MADLPQRIPTRDEMLVELQAAEGNPDKQRVILEAIAALHPTRELTGFEKAATGLLSILPSAGRTALTSVQPVLHPIATAEAIRDLATKPEARAAFADYYKNRYGSMEGFEKALIEDPVGVFADIATPFTLGGSAGARLPGVAGRIARGAERVGEYTDPLTLAGKGAAKVIPGILGMTTGAGTDVISEAARIGREGSEKERVAFLEGMRNPEKSFGVTIDAAKEALKNFKSEYQANYRDRMAVLPGAYDPIDITPIVQSVIDIENSLKTQTGLSKAGATEGAILKKISDDVNIWLANPAEHNAIGFNDLKQKIAGYYPEAKAAGQGKRVVESIENAIDKTISDAGTVPGLKDINAEYSKSKRLAQELESTFSLSPSATSRETALKKLQAAGRDNVQTSYGYRRELLRQMEENGGVPLFPSIAGQSLSAGTPRGIVSKGAGVAAGVLSARDWLTNLLQGGGPSTGQILSTLALAPAFSPRLVGEAAYKVGQAQKAAIPLRPLYSPAARSAAYQVGKIPGLLNEEE
jgi:hypothetical protein